MHLRVSKVKKDEAEQLIIIIIISRIIIIRIRQELEPVSGGHCLEIKRKHRSEKWGSRRTVCQEYPELILLRNNRGGVLPNLAFNQHG